MMTSWTSTCITPVSTPTRCVKSQFPGGSRPRLAILMLTASPKKPSRSQSACCLFGEAVSKLCGALEKSGRACVVAQDAPAAQAQQLRELLHVEG